MSRSGHVQTANKAQINQQTSQAKVVNATNKQHGQPEAKSKHYRKNESRSETSTLRLGLGHCAVRPTCIGHHINYVYNLHNG